MLFPQMKPEKKVVRDSAEAFGRLGVPAEWVEPLYAAGVNTVADMTSMKPGKVHQMLCDINKKNKLGLAPLKQEEVAEWFNNKD